MNPQVPIDAPVDHYRAVRNAVPAKAVSGKHVSAADDEVGGTTITYDLWPGHPGKREVAALSASTPKRVIPLWERITGYNRDRASGVTYQVKFYCGQYLVEEEGGS
jgi:hypothetical protein